MAKWILFFVTAISVLFFTNCKKAEETSTPNIATEVVANLSVISNGYNPVSLQSNSSASVGAQSDPCANTTDFAVCQSNLIREYLRIGKSTVDLLSELAGNIGAALGEVPDGNAGTSANGKISWNKTSAAVWSVLVRGTGAATTAYFSVNNGVYTLKVDKNFDEDDPSDQQIEAVVTYTSAAAWTVDVYFGNNVCSAIKPEDPSKAHIVLTKGGGLWTGKAMLFVPRWKAPGTTVSCATTGSEIAMYTDFVGNDESTKAALYLYPVPGSASPMGTVSNYEIPDFCTNFPTSCDGGPGELTAGVLTPYPNNWCTTGAGTTPTWSDNCSSNAAVSPAAFSSAAVWTTPYDLKNKSVTMPTTL